MTTLRKRLEELCAQHNKPVPYGMHLDNISMAVINKIKEIGQYDTITKAEEIMMVNNYPDTALAVIDEVILAYFSGGPKATTVKESKKPKFFSYDVPAHKAEAFEAALIVCGIPVMQNYVRYGKAQYIIPITIPSQLVGLGKMFQKERYNQEYRNRKAKLNLLKTNNRNISQNGSQC